MSAIVDVDNNTGRQLDSKAQPDEQVSESDVQDPSKLARLLTRILSLLAGLLRSHKPRRTLFVNMTVDATGTTVYRLPHKFGGAVTWTVAGWRDGATGWGLVEESSTDKDTLCLVSFVAGNVDILVEERG
jgi:hypothetical protein